MRWLVFMAAIWLGLSATASAKRVALVIGNGAYEHASPLPNPANDANAMSAALERMGFEVILGLDQSRGDTLATLSEFARALEGAEAGLLFYAGHGIQVAGVNYIVPVDAALARESDVFLSLVSMDDVLRVMETEVPTRLVLLDACRDNPLSRTLKRSMGTTRSASVGQGLARVDTAAGTLIAYSTAPGDVAEDGEGRNSPFTTALLAHIETPGLEARQVLTRVRNDVQIQTAGRQLPWDSSSLTGDFYFNGDVTIQITPAPEPPAQSTPNPQGAELLFWESVKDSERSGDYQAYLDAFGDNGLFAALAQARLASLDPRAQPEAEPDFTPNPTQWRQVQAALNALGYDAGTPDGRPGPRTETALAQWQRTAGLAAGAGLSLAQLQQLLAAVPPQTAAPQTGETFKDCALCPEMVVVPAGDVMLGAEPGDPGYEADEWPRQRVTIAKPFAIGKFEVTRAEFGQFIEATGHRPQQGCYDLAIVNFLNADYDWSNNRRSTADDHPVVCVSKRDAKAYAGWLRERTGETYRLPSEAEFTRAAAGGETGFYAWAGGLAAACEYANVYDRVGASDLPYFPWSALACRDGAAGTASVGSYQPNGYGLYDMVGNAMEYVEDCWFGNLDGHPGDGRAWTNGGDCTQTVIKGGGFWPPETGYQLPDRWNVPTQDGGFDSQGFRLVRELDQ